MHHVVRGAGRAHRFCNVFRAADRVSRYMIRDVSYHDESCIDGDRLFQFVAFRTFSKTDCASAEWARNSPRTPTA